MGDIESIELVDRWVFDDLSSSAFSDEERKRVLDDIDTLAEHLTVWDRDLNRCVDILSGTSDVTIYRRRAGDLRSFFVRTDDTLYCIGVGKRRSTYDRDLGAIQNRAREHGDRDDDRN
jgi:hypothetical protein